LSHRSRNHVDYYPVSVFIRVEVRSHQLALVVYNSKRLRAQELTALKVTPPKLIFCVGEMELDIADIVLIRTSWLPSLRAWNFSMLTRVFIVLTIECIQDIENLEDHRNLGYFVLAPLWKFVLLYQ
jgi:hypothetical protein